MVDRLRANLIEGRLDCEGVESYGFRLFLASATSEEEEERKLPRYGNESVHLTTLLQRIVGSLVLASKKSYHTTRQKHGYEHNYHQANQFPECE